MADEGDDQRDAQDQGTEGTEGTEKEAPRESTDQESLIPDEERAEDGQVYVERDNLDFDPEEGLYSGTAVHGGTDIPGPHEQVDDIDPNDTSSDGDEERSADDAGDTGSDDEG